MAIDNFLYGTKLSDRISDILKGSDVICATAFIGNGASCWISKGSGPTKIVCNLAAGGTNPYEIEKLQEIDNVEIKQHDTLHAKVYHSSNGTIVTSANLSANGLGLEEKECSHWIEAGCEVDDTSGVEKWLDQIWYDSADITSKDIENAKKKWKLRRLTKPTVASPAQLSLIETEVPIVGYWGTEDYSLTEAGQKAMQHKDAHHIDEDIFYWVDFHSEKDIEYLEGGRWILGFRKNKGSGEYSKKYPPEWAFVDTIVKDGIEFEGRKQILAFGTKASHIMHPFQIPSGRKWMEWLSVYKQELEELDKCYIEKDGETEYFNQKRVQKSIEFWKELGNLQSNQ